jgi:hypothetical protein
VPPTFATQLFGFPKINSLMPNNTKLRATKPKMILKKIFSPSLRKSSMRFFEEVFKEKSRGRASIFIEAI